MFLPTCVMLVYCPYIRLTGIWSCLLGPQGCGWCCCVNWVLDPVSDPNSIPLPDMGIRCTIVWSWGTSWEKARGWWTVSWGLAHPRSLSHIKSNSSSRADLNYLASMEGKEGDNREGRWREAEMRYGLWDEVQRMNKWKNHHTYWCMITSVMQMS